MQNIYKFDSVVILCRVFTSNELFKGMQFIFKV